MTRGTRARKITTELRKAYPDACCALHHKNPLELLVATILAAQCTDERVNRLTPALFRKYRTAEDLARADLKTLEAEIRPAGFYRQKAKSLKSMGTTLTERSGGQVPRTLEELVTLPGVWRKTANVLLGTCFGVPGIVVDTHVRRLAFRMGLSSERDPDKIEQDLARQIPRREWTFFSYAMTFHGRQVCKALKPACPACPVNALCPKQGVSRPSGKG